MLATSIIQINMKKKILTVIILLVKLPPARYAIRSSQGFRVRYLLSICLFTYRSGPRPTEMLESTSQPPSRWAQHNLEAALGTPDGFLHAQLSAATIVQASTKPHCLYCTGTAARHHVNDG